MSAHQIESSAEELIHDIGSQVSSQGTVADEGNPIAQYSLSAGTLIERVMLIRHPLEG